MCVKPQEIMIKSKLNLYQKKARHVISLFSLQQTKLCGNRFASLKDYTLWEQQAAEPKTGFSFRKIIMMMRLRLKCMRPI